MPLPSRRRSALALLAANTRVDTADSRPSTGWLQPDDPPSPRAVSEHAHLPSRLSHEVLRDDVPDPPGQDASSSRKPKRFSMLKSRNFSESHLAVKAKEMGGEASREDAPSALPFAPTAVPAIVKTAPTMDADAGNDGEREAVAERKLRPSLFQRSISAKKSSSPVRKDTPRKSLDERRRGPGVEKKSGSSLRWRRLQGRSTGLEDLQRLSAQHIANNHHHPVAPPSYGDESNSALALPVNGPRFSESSRSDGSNGSSDQIYGSTTTTTHTVSTHTTFFKLPRRNKNRNSLFPLPVKLPPPNDPHSQRQESEEPTTPRASTSAFSTKSLQATPHGQSPPTTVLQRRHTETSPTKQRRQPQPPPLPTNALAKASLSFAEPGLNLARNDSQRSRDSSRSSPLQPPMRLGLRDRASTNSSLGRSSHDIGTPPPMPGSARNSTSTTGRSSLGGFLNLSRFRQGSDPHSPRHGSPGTRSKSNSFAMSREALVIPEREEGDTPGRYLERLEAAVARSMIAGILSKSADPFAQAVLRSYTRRFPFFGEPIDMSLRKFLLEAELPKETQQVDRVIQAFADRYHECNPGIFTSPDQAYIIAFSLMMLHTDAFNKNNKRKMQKHDYIKNTSGQQVSDDVLGCFYDNICYTPFVHYEEEVDINGERVMPFKLNKKSKLKVGAITDSGKKPSGPVDPYNLLVEQRLDFLRPAIKDSITLDDPYNYRGSQGDLDLQYLQRAFTHTGILQIISQRSRPTAYEGQFTNNAPTNPLEMQPGIIDLKITKVGTLWRKAMKRKKARSPWQEWGAILTGSQLYLFKNAHWAKGLVHQFMAAQRHGQPRIPVVFKPPLQEFKPDALIKTDNAVALVDASYTRHKHAFTLVRPGGQEEVLLADNESELNEWLALINYAAAFKTMGVRIRGMIGSTEEDVKRGEVRRLDSTQSARSVHSLPGSAHGEVIRETRGLSIKLHRQIMTARRQVMVQRVGEANTEIANAIRHLDSMVRNARHLQVLAPIAPKTREDIIHAAAHADANIKWTRRDIWRLKCHRDILAMDVQQDGVSASELETLSREIEESEGAKKGAGGRLRALSRLNSKATSFIGTKSPPRSPTSPSSSGGARPSTTGSLTETFMGVDVFRTPTESATTQQQLRGSAEGWKLPPLQLDVAQNQDPDADRRESGTSTHLSATASATSPPRAGRPSLSHASSATSALRQPDEPKGKQRIVTSPTPSSEHNSRAGIVTPTPSIDSRELARNVSFASQPVSEHTASKNINVDGATATPLATATTPDTATASSKQQHRSSGVRRSLQKTLRDAHHYTHHNHSHQSSAHKHKRNKESDSTVRSGGDKTSENTAEDGVVERTPGLMREKGRFILHGKQASVVQFHHHQGGEWPDEHMRLRREKWRQSSYNSSNSAGKDAEGSVGLPSPSLTQTRGSSYGSAGFGVGAAGRGDVMLGSPVIQDFDRNSEAEDESEDGTATTVDEDDGGSPDTRFRQDVQAAAAFEASTASPTPLALVQTPRQGDLEEGKGGAKEEPHEYFDLLTWDPQRGKRGTVIGPGVNIESSVAAEGQKSNDESRDATSNGPQSLLPDPDVDGAEKTSNRRTVIGPSRPSGTAMHVNGRPLTSASESASAGADEEDEGHEQETWHDASSASEVDGPTGR